MKDQRSESHTPEWARAFFDTRDQMRGWIEEAVERHRSIAYRGGHDEGTFISSWFGFHQLFGCPEAIDFARYLRDGFARWSREHMTHGFYPEGEAHHQTEIFTFFLCRLWRVAPDDVTAELIVDAAHHIGNWVDSVPDWYCHDEHRFLSWRIGSERVGSGASAGYEVPDHFRLIQLALVAREITNEQRYLDLATDYADRWAEAILGASESEFPTVIRSGDTEADREEVMKAIGAHHQSTSDLEGVEPHVPGGTVDVFLDLYEITGEQRYADGARRICEALMPALADPYSNPPGALLARYRTATGDRSLDGDVEERLRAGIEETLAGLDGMLRFLDQTRVSGYALAAARLYASLSDNPFAEGLLDEYADQYEELVGERPVTGTRAETPALIAEPLNRTPVAGIGKRNDMVRWGWESAAGALRPTHALPPPSLMLAYLIEGDDLPATRALQTVATRMALARLSLRDGRDHGCGGTTVAAVASGHGRDGGYGNVTGALFPLAAGMVRRLCQEEPLVCYRQPNGREHLPESVAALVRSLPAAGAEVLLWNDAHEPVKVGIALRNTGWRTVELASRKATKLELP